MDHMLDVNAKRAPEGGWKAEARNGGVSGDRNKPINIRVFRTK